MGYRAGDLTRPYALDNVVHGSLVVEERLLVEDPIAHPAGQGVELRLVAARRHGDVLGLAEPQHLVLGVRLDAAQVLAQRVRPGDHLDELAGVAPAHGVPVGRQQGGGRGAGLVEASALRLSRGMRATSGGVAR